MNNTNTHNKEQHKKSEEVINTSDLLKYLKERIKLRTKSIRSIDNYDNKVWIGDIPESENCKVPSPVKRPSNMLLCFFTNASTVTGSFSGVSGMGDFFHFRNISLRNMLFVYIVAQIQRLDYVSAKTMVFARILGKVI